MARDPRDLFKEDHRTQNAKMSVDHESRFLQKLNAEFPKDKPTKRFGFLSIAASVILMFGLSYGAFKYFKAPIKPSEPTKIVQNKIKSLGDISPDLKKVEDYYLASINLELSKVQLTPENKDLFDGYILRLKELNEEYNKLTIELNESGPNEETLDALIDNLKYRLNLVMRLKTKLKEFNDGTYTQESI